MIKILFATLFVVSSFCASAQTISFNVSGIVKDTTNAKFAYLTTTTQQVPISSPKIFMIVPIIAGKFEFVGTFDLEGKDFQHACVIIEERGNISKEEAASKFKQLIWISGREKNMKIVMLEDVKLEIDSRQSTKEALVVEQGALTRQLDAYSVAVRAKEGAFINFLKKYSDSQLSLYQVEEHTSSLDLSSKEKMESIMGSPQEMYDALSERLKVSLRGLAIKEKITIGYK